MFSGLYSRGSIKKKITFLVTSLLMVALFSVLVVVSILINKQVGSQTEKLFVSNASALNQAIEQRLSYLTENTKLLATNDLMVNAFTDVAGRQAYLTPLVSNFATGKNVRHLDVVDFDGRPIFQMGEKIPNYQESDRLRAALALNQNVLFIDEANDFVIISPIEYYSTTQGALIIRFDLNKIVQESTENDSNLYTRLLNGKKVIFSEGYDVTTSYKSYLQSNNEYPSFKKLGIYLEVGLPSNQYHAPVREAILAVLVIGIILLTLSILTSHWVADRISYPILELVSRVKRAHAGEDIQCSPLGSGDELDSLAKVFDERTLMLEYQAEHDDLTKLPNRLLFVDRLEHAIKVAERNNESFAVLFIDLDRFKEVNDLYGHSVGDVLLKVVAEKIANTLRDSDSVARIGGDEFTVLVDNIHHQEDLALILQNLLSLFDKPIAFANHQFYLTCSIGAAVFPADGSSPDELLKNADAAMYKAKEEGRNTYRFYQQDLTDRIIKRIQIEQDLREAIERDQFIVHFQPQYELKTGEIVGMEALLRWMHPNHGLIPPLEFIPLAEETGMIVEIDRLMMISAMKEFSQWQQAGLNPGILSMNLSMVQLAQEDFFPFVERSMSACKIASRDIMFEVTETQAMLNPKQTIVMLENLKSIGVGLAIDDFGTGFSSLAYLKNFPVNKLKIDRSFISNIPDDKEDNNLTKAIIAIAHSLNLTVIAEGVETKEQEDFLDQNGCNEGQGYLFSRPVDGKEILTLLEQQNQNSLN